MSDPTARLLLARGLVGLCALLLFGACAKPVTVHTFDPSRAYAVNRIGIMPVEIAPTPSGGELRVDEDGSRVVASRLVEALTIWSGIPFAPPEALAHWLKADLDSRQPRCPAGGDPLCSSRALASAFGVDALLFVNLQRYRARVGSRASARRPAAVWFDLELRTPDGVLLWRGIYDETQRGLSEDLGSFQRAYQRRFRWVSAETLASYGSGELVRQLAAEIRQWR